MDSIPPARTTLASPNSINCAAETMDLDAGSANAIYGERGNFNRQSRPERHVTGAIERVAAGLHRVSKDRMIELARLQLRLLDRSLTGNGAQFQSRKFPQ